jgi:hypothetical protein
MPHIDDGILHALLDGALPALAEAGALPEGLDVAGVEAHLRACTDCRARLEAERIVRERAGVVLDDAALAAVDVPPFEQLTRAPQVRRTSRWVPLAWAASLALALGAGWWGSVVFRGEPQRVAGALDHASLRAEQEAAAPTAAPAAPAEPATASAAADAPGPEAVAAAPAARALPGSEPVSNLAPAAPARPPVAASAAFADASAEAARADVPGEATQRGQHADAAIPAAADPLLDRHLGAAREAIRLAEAGALEWLPLPARGAELVHEQVFVLTDAGQPAIETARTLGGTLVRVRQRLPGGELVELYTWRETVLALSEIVVTGTAAPRRERVQREAAGEPTQQLRSEALAAPQADAAAKALPPSMTAAALRVDESVLPNGAREVVLRIRDSDVLVVVRGNVPFQTLHSLAERLVPGS